MCGVWEGPPFVSTDAYGLNVNSVNNLRLQFGILIQSVTIQSLGGSILDIRMSLLADKLDIFKNKNSRLNKLLKIRRMKSFLTHPCMMNGKGSR